MDRQRPKHARFVVNTYCIVCCYHLLHFAETSGSPWTNQTWTPCLHIKFFSWMSSWDRHFKQADLSLLSNLDLTMRLNWICLQPVWWHGISALWDLVLFLEESSWVSACTVGVTVGCFPCPAALAIASLSIMLLFTTIPLLFAALND